jgi:ubiquinone biosynthesis protein UbiJ
MLQSVRELMLPAAQARLLLLANHVVSREPVAMHRLRAHAGRRVSVELLDQPAWLPALPSMRVLVTAAGLFDRDPQPPEVAADLTMRLSFPGPERLLAVLAGATLPEVRIDGAAAVAADMHWLADNLRWDVEADLAEMLGAVPARVVVAAGRASARTLRRVVASAAPTAATAPDSGPR